MSVIQDDLKAFMLTKNLLCNKPIEFDGKIHRYSAQGGHNESEWYVAHIFDEDKSLCIFGSWKNLDNKHTWRSHKNYDIEKEREALNEINERIEKERSVQIKEATKRMLAAWESATPCIEHPYIEKKQIETGLLKTKDGYLLIPLSDIEKDLVSIQTINPEGQKRFYYGIPVAGLFHPTSAYEKAPEIIFCEGIATAYSIQMAVHKPVIACMSAGNVCLVATAFKQRYRNTRLVFAADKDKAGLETVAAWKQYINANIFIPDSEKEKVDFNDLYIEKGADYVRANLTPTQIMPMLRSIFLKLEDEEEVKINEFLIEGSFNIIYGEAGVGKSRVAYELGHCLSAGYDFLGYETYKKSNVFYIDAEMSVPEIKKRMNEIAKRYPSISHDEDQLSILSSLKLRKDTKQSIDLYDEKCLSQLEEAMESNDVIILDNYGRLTSSIGADNFRLDIKRWQALSSWFQKFQAIGKTIILIMHSTKSKSLQGTYQIKNDADLILALRKPINMDDNVLAHFGIFYEKCRSIPAYKQLAMNVRLYENKKNIGWNYREMDSTSARELF